MDTIVMPQAVFFQADARIPNNPRLPVLVYRKVLDPKMPGKDDLFRSRFGKNNWRGAWKGPVFDYHHFHPNAHEVLGVASGKAQVMLGGENGKVFDLEAGDLVVLPAGTGHKLVEDSSNFAVIGAYPAGQEDYDICRSIGECPDAGKRIASLPRPETDPFYGSAGPLLQLWPKV